MSHKDDTTIYVKKTFSIKSPIITEINLTNHFSQNGNSTENPFCRFKRHPSRMTLYTIIFDQYYHLP